MSTNSTTVMLERFRLEAGTPGFFGNIFTTKPRGVHTTENVEIDVIREEEDIAVPVQSITSSYRDNERSKFVNKGFPPPILKEQFGVVVWETIKRQAGMNPFESPDFARAAGEQAFDGVRLLSNKVRRTVELMGSQAMQTGVISIPDAAGNVAYTLDFGMRSSHKITATTWAADGSTGTPLADISSAAQIVRKDGKKRCDQLVFGNGAMQRFLANTKVQLQLDKFKLNLGALQPGMKNEDSTFYGYIWIDNYQYEIWLLDSYYKHPQTGTLTPYMADNKVIVRASKARMDLSWGLIPRMVPPDARSQQFMPSRLTALDLGMDLQPYSYIPSDGESLIINIGARPLCIPVEIDSYACITAF
jgi:hypothetical protein